MNKKISLTFFGGVGSATGANIMLQYGDKKILVDCGLTQGGRGAEEKNFAAFEYDPKTIDFLLITHAHMDHIGRVPKLVRDGFRGRIISTEETRELAEPMLLDAMRVIKARHPDKTLFDENDLEKTLSLWEGGKYGEKITLSSDCYLEMQDAGHVLGSAIISVTCGEGKEVRKITFTGDLGNSPSPLLPDTDIPEDLDYMVIESVYGDRNHESKKERRNKLKQAILKGIKKEGAIVIPAFSIERTQVLLYEINNMIEDKEIPLVPVFLDSPLAERVTRIYQKYSNDFKGSVQKEIKDGDDIFDFPGLKIVGRASESAEIEKTGGAKIILSGSGMSEGGRVVNHEAHYLPDPKATIILVGYQAIGTLGRALQDGKREVYISPPNPPLTLRGGQGNSSHHYKEKIKVRAEIENITGYSSHKDSEHLLEFVEKTNTPPLSLRSDPPLGQGREGAKLNPNVKGLETDRKRRLKVFVIMGEPKSSLFLAQRIREYLGIEAIYPEEGKEYELE